MRAFVTGSTGLLGNNLVHTLIEQGHEVRALARSREKAARHLGDTRAEIVIGDLSDPAAFADALDGVDALFNTAAYFNEYYRKGGESWEDLKRVNIDATLELFRIAEAHGVRRIVHTSSSGTIGVPPKGQPADESTPPDAYSMENLYFRSKVLGDQAIAEHARTSQTAIMTVKPTLILGPRDVGPTNFGGFLIDLMTGNVPAVPSGVASVVDARDAADGMIRAALNGRSGEHYIMNAGLISTTDIARVMTDVVGRRPYLTMPHPVGMTLGFFSEMFASLTGGDPLVTRRALRTFQMDFAVSSAKAQRDLGVRFRPIRETLRDEALWFIANGYAKGITRAA